MEQIDTLFDKAVGEIERLLSTKTVVGEAITIEDSTLIPLVNVGFGFGAGGGQGPEAQTGSGTGGGGGIKPVAVIIANADGVRVEPIKSGAASVLEKVTETIGKAATANKNGTSRE